MDINEPGSPILDVNDMDINPQSAIPHYRCELLDVAADGDDDDDNESVYSFTSFLAATCNEENDDDEDDSFNSIDYSDSSSSSSLSAPHSPSSTGNDDYDNNGENEEMMVRQDGGNHVVNVINNNYRYKLNANNDDADKAVADGAFEDALRPISPFFFDSSPVSPIADDYDSEIEHANKQIIDYIGNCKRKLAEYEEKEKKKATMSQSELFSRHLKEIYDAEFDCPICLNEVTGKLSVVFSGCTHAVCIPCVKDMLKAEHSSTLCPLCKADSTGLYHSIYKLQNGFYTMVAYTDTTIFEN